MFPDAYGNPSQLIHGGMVMPPVGYGLAFGSANPYAGKMPAITGGEKPFGPGFYREALPGDGGSIKVPLDNAGAMPAVMSTVMNSFVMQQVRCP